MWRGVEKKRGLSKSKGRQQGNVMVTFPRMARKSLERSTRENIVPGYTRKRRAGEG